MAGSTRPGGRSATSSWSALMAETISSAAWQGAVASRAGWVMVTPHGTTSLPVEASVDRSSSAMTDRRFVSPVTTASGNATGGTGVGLGVAVGDGVGLGDGDGDGVRAGLEQETSNARAMVRAVTRIRAGECIALS